MAESTEFIAKVHAANGGAAEEAQETIAEMEELLLGATQMSLPQRLHRLRETRARFEEMVDDGAIIMAGLRNHFFIETIWVREFNPACC